MRVLALTTVLALTACMPAPQGVGFRGGLSIAQIEKCSADTGFTARTKGEVGAKATPTEVKAMDACLAARKATPRTLDHAPQKVETTVTGPNTYTQTYTHGTPPTTPAHKAASPRGRLPIPSEYPLQAGDEALWYSLTLDQQRRALLFLRDGSTIRASLEG